MTYIKSMALAPHLMAAARSGEKTLTIRMGRRNLKLGPIEVYNADNDSSVFTMCVEALTYCRLGDVPIDDAMADGFKTPKELFEGLRKFYPSITWESEVTLVHWTLPENYTSLRGLEVVEGSSMFCEHANENPSACPCKDDCYCKSNTCKVDA